jgi:hypothetical protein
MTKAETIRGLLLLLVAEGYDVELLLRHVMRSKNKRLLRIAAQVMQRAGYRERARPGRG